MERSRCPRTARAASVVFALADGVAYESVEPRMPLMSLIASND